MRTGTLVRFGLSVVLCSGLVLAACAEKAVPTDAQLRHTGAATAVLSSAPADNTPEKPDREPVLTGDDSETLMSMAVLPTETATAAGRPTPTPLPGRRLRQLTSGGCCTNPSWSAENRFVQFIDRPPSRAPGIYGVDVERLGPPTLVSEWIVETSGGLEFFVYPDGNKTIVQRAATGERYVIANGGRRVSVSPDGQRLLWQVMDRQGDFDKRRSQIWIANVDGSDARVVGETVGVSWGEWIDRRRILLAGVPLENRRLVSIAILTLGTETEGDTLLELDKVVRPRETLISPGGNWLVYLLAFQPDPRDDGIWVAPTDGRQPPHRPEFFGGYRWRDDSHLLYIPMEPGAESHVLWEYDAENQVSRRLTDPDRTPFRIANNDWAVSNDGRYIAYVNAADHNLWLIDLELLP